MRKGMRLIVLLGILRPVVLSEIKIEIVFPPADYEFHGTLPYCRYNVLNWDVPASGYSVLYRDNRMQEASNRSRVVLAAGKISHGEHTYSVALFDREHRPIGVQASSRFFVTQELAPKASIARPRRNQRLWYGDAIAISASVEYVEFPREGLAVLSLDGTAIHNLTDYSRATLTLPPGLSVGRHKVELQPLGRNGVPSAPQAEVSFSVVRHAGSLQFIEPSDESVICAGSGVNVIYDAPWLWSDSYAQINVTDFVNGMAVANIAQRSEPFATEMVRLIALEEGAHWVRLVPRDAQTGELVGTEASVFFTVTPNCEAALPSGVGVDGTDTLDTGGWHFIDLECSACRTNPLRSIEHAQTVSQQPAFSGTSSLGFRYAWSESLLDFV